METKRIVVKEIAKCDFLGSRFSGELIRNLMKEYFDRGEIVTLDFSGIEGITQSFGDEIIGIFVRSFGVDFIKRHVKLENANDKVRGILNWVVKYSKKINEFSVENNNVAVIRPDVVFAQKMSSPSAPVVKGGNHVSMF